MFDSIVWVFIGGSLLAVGAALLGKAVHWVLMFFGEE